MQKNVASQKWVVFAFNRTTNAPLTGDAANITGNLRLDGGVANAIDDLNPTELEDGYYVFDITAAESNADSILLTAQSVTSDIQVVGCPPAVWTRPPNFDALGIESGGAISSLNGHTAQTGDTYVLANGAAGFVAIDTVVDSTLALLGTPAADVSADIAAVKVDTAEIGAAGAGLTAINLPNQTMDITGNLSGSVGSVTGAVGSVTGAVGSVTGAVGSVTGNIGGNVVGSVASVTGAVGSVAGAVDGNVTGSVGSLAAQAKADVNAEVVDTLITDTYTEPGQEAPGVNISLATKIGYLYKAWRNRSTQNATQFSLYADDTTTLDHKATVSDDGTTADKGEVTTGP